MRIMVVVALVALVGCQSEAKKERAAERRAAGTAAWQACIDLGGVPIESFIGYPAMSDCDYPEVVEP